MAVAGLGTLLGILAGFFILILVLGVAVYVYMSWALMALAKRTNTPHKWMAWIPYLNLYLIAKIADKNWLPVLILIVPFILGLLSQSTIISVISFLFGIAFLVFYIIWWWNICKIRGKPGWWALIMIIPVAGQIWWLIMIGLLAWGKDETTSVPTPTAPSQPASNSS